MIDLSRVTNYYVACGYTDLRRGIDGLASIETSRTPMLSFSAAGINLNSPSIEAASAENT